MKNKLSKISTPIMALAAVAMMGAGFGIAVIASADTTTPTAASTTNSVTQPTGMQGHRGVPGVMGKVIATSGTTLTVTSTNPKDHSTTTYTVDASNAKVMKSAAPTASSSAPAVRQAPATVPVTDIAVGDTVSVRGTISGTTVTATSIMDGVMWGGRGGPGGSNHGASGTITAINGSTVTITGKNGTTYTVNAGSAKLEKVSTISVSGLAVGDTIQASGTLSGTSVTATNILDGSMMGGK